MRGRGVGGCRAAGVGGSGRRRHIRVTGGKIKRRDEHKHRAVMLGKKHVHLRDAVSLSHSFESAR